MKSRASESAARAKKAAPEKGGAAQDSSFPIVAIGASAGGLEAYTEFFRGSPPESGMAYVLVQHLDPNHPSMLAEILSKSTRMQVNEVKSGVKLKPGCAYVIPPNALMVIEGGVFKLTPRVKGKAQQLAINCFMHSLAEECKSRAIGIVLSGTGVDGCSGLEDIKAEGGITFAQEPGTAKFDGMPRAAIGSGCVDFVLPPREMAKELHRILRHPYVHQPAPEKDRDGADAESSPAPVKDEFSALIAQLQKSSGVDFSQYKPNTIHRRALRRMMILELESLGEYAAYLKEHPDEGQKLYDDVLIPVTSFFRDFEAFEALKSQVYPAIVKDKANKGAIRMWAPGCSTGEEAYSLAMTLLEFLGDRASSFQVQIFGTDLNDKGIQKARAGVYRESIAEEISPERMARFFVKVDEGYRVNKAVRDMCVFARQNLAVDPPFSQMNVLACRNLLIYMQQSLQKKVIPILHYALKPYGYLVLGSSESVSTFPDLFASVDKKHRIYSKKAVSSRLHYDFLQNYYPPATVYSPRIEAKQAQETAASPAKSEFDAQAAADNLVLKEHAPVGVVINPAMEVVQFRGRTSPYLEQTHGKPSLNVLKLARNGLGTQLRTLIAAAQKEDAPMKKDGVAFGENGRKRVLNLSVTPLGGREERERRFFLVLFEDVTPLWVPDPEESARPERKPSAKKAAGPTEAHKREIKQLRHELALTQDALGSAIEAEDSLKEDYQSANEEIVSANEELQSTNEELETSKEELQSANEELNTLNSELHQKNVELRDLSNDLTNLLNSTRIPVVMLDRQLHIRRLTPAAHRLMKVRPSDIGRPLADIRLNIDLPGLEGMIAKVLDDLQPLEREVRDFDGHWHSLNILPYQTQDNKIDGAVLAMQDIEAIKSAGEELQRSSDFFRGVVDTVREPLLVLDGELRVVAANRSFLEMFRLTARDTVNQFLYAVGNGQWSIPALRELLEQVLPKHEIVTDFKMETEFEGVGSKSLLLNARTLTQANDRRPMILLAMENVTERRQAQEDLLVSEDRFRMIADNMSQLAWTCDDDLGNVTWYNQRWLDYTGMKSKDMEGWDWSKVQHPDHRARVIQGVERSRDTGEIWEDTFPLRGKDGKYRWFLSRAVPIRAADGKVLRWFGTNTDITERRQAETALVKSEKLAAAGRLAATLAHEINNPLQAVVNLMDLLRHSMELKEQDRAYATMAGEELLRVARLTQQSLGFYRESASSGPVNLVETIENILDLYSKRIGRKKIVVDKQFREERSTIHSYAGEVRQVLSTLLVNAMDAVAPGGRIAVRVHRKASRRNFSVQGVQILIADSGIGIPPQNMARIFEPFFTTKGEQGTGLGLWVAHGIVNRLGGWIGVRSSLRKDASGTCFVIFLPDRLPGTE